jgi:hypothetical protein
LAVVIDSRSVSRFPLTNRQLASWYVPRSGKATTVAEVEREAAADFLAVVFLAGGVVEGFRVAAFLAAGLRPVGLAGDGARAGALVVGRVAGLRRGGAVLVVAVVRLAAGPGGGPYGAPAVAGWTGRLRRTLPMRNKMAATLAPMDT